jgi:hypothetical protein
VSPSICNTVAATASAVHAVTNPNGVEPGVAALQLDRCVYAVGAVSQLATTMVCADPSGRDHAEPVKDATPALEPMLTHRALFGNCLCLQSPMLILVIPCGLPLWVRWCSIRRTAYPCRRPRQLSLSPPVADSMKLWLPTVTLSLLRLVRCMAVRP